MTRAKSQSNLNNENVFYFLTGTFLGSALTYFLDSDRGAYRRHLLLDKGVHYKRNTKFYGGKMFRHLRNKSQGLVARASQMVSEEEMVPNEILVARVRSQMGRVVSHTKSIDVTAFNGTVYLSGNILTHEVDDLLYCVENVRGVDEVINELEVHETAENIPDLQGEGPDYFQTE